VLLQRGAARVIALDVGRGQLHPRLRDDPRVVVLERTNARGLDELPFAPELVTCDVSFISVRKALPPALGLAAPEWQALVLVKPQFEAGRAEARRGVVRDPEVWRRVLRETAEAALGWQAQAAGVVDSGLPGPKGNREFFLQLVHRERPELPDELERWIDEAIG
jgi:23S rRNA (cytidine1920-2'-O)/16S rRNA (cytidine1409-2'-O)-methyltransferase